MRWARPSTTAVLPTPGSPISTGLFLVRRDSTWTTRRISASRPMTGSILPSRAAAVRSTPYFSSAWKVPSGSGLVTRAEPRTDCSASAQRVRVAPCGRAGRRRRRPARPARAAGARWRRTRRERSRASRSAAPSTASRPARSAAPRPSAPAGRRQRVDQALRVGPHAPAGRRRPPAAAGGSGPRRRRAGRRPGGPARRPGCPARPPCRTALAHRLLAAGGHVHGASLRSVDSPTVSAGAGGATRPIDGRRWSAAAGQLGVDVVELGREFGDPGPQRVHV